MSIQYRPRYSSHEYEDLYKKMCEASAEEDAAPVQTITEPTIEDQAFGNESWGNWGKQTKRWYQVWR